MSNFEDVFEFALGDWKETKELLGNPTLENMLRVYIATTRWARYWAENWPTEEGRQKWKNSLAETKPDYDRFIAALNRYGKKHKLFEIVRIQ
jgi:hypothetical protein